LRLHCVCGVRQSLCLLAIIVIAENNIKIEYTIWLSKGDY
jgi:hypothetical protein